MNETADERFDRIDAELEELRDRVRRIEGELGITRIGPEGLPTSGERRPHRAAAAVTHA